MKKALISGVTGQDGSYLAEYLLSFGYEVHGIVRRASTFNTKRIDHILAREENAQGERFVRHYGDLTDATNLIRIIQQVQPDLIFNLAAQSHVKVSFETPEYTANADGLGVLRLLEAIRLLGMASKVKFYQASTSELYGKARETPQTENTPFYPRSPYGVAKLYAHWMTKNYREAYDMFACCGILFNHSSARRGETFASRKITRGLALIKAGKEKKLLMGKLEAKRDFGFAPEYVMAMYKMLQQEKPADFVIATGETHSIREFLERAFQYAGLGDWQKYVEIDPRYFRPTDVDALVGDAIKAKQELGWEPKIKFDELIKIMVDADLRKYGLQPPGEGDKILKEKFPDKWWEED